MSKNKTRKSLAQIKMVQQGYLTMYGCKDKLCLDAEVTLVTSRHPKMLAAYTHKLHPLAEKKMVETGQHQMLKEYRFELEEENQAKQRAEIEGVQLDIGWGSQIRSYVFQPYTMVKDHRTDEETGDAIGVLEGDLDRFIQAYLRASVGET